MISQTDPIIYFLLKGEVEIFHKKSIRSKEITKLTTLKVLNIFIFINYNSTFLFKYLRKEVILEKCHFLVGNRK